MTNPWKPVGTTIRIDHSALQRQRERARRFLETAQEARVIRLVGDGQVAFSTTLDLEPTRVIIWDTNGYYRSLGVSPYASRAEIRDAYLRLNGHRSHRLTIIVKTLLDRDTRARYDRTPLGCFWAHDDALKTRIVPTYTQEDFDLDPDLEVPEEPDDGLRVLSVDESWAVYAMLVRDDEIDWTDVARLRARIASVFSREGITRSVALGILPPGSTNPFSTMIDGTEVIFLPLGIDHQDSLV